MAEEPRKSETIEIPFVRRHVTVEVSGPCSESVVPVRSENAWTFLLPPSGVRAVFRLGAQRAILGESWSVPVSWLEEEVRFKARLLGAAGPRLVPFIELRTDFEEEFAVSGAGGELTVQIGGSPEKAVRISLQVFEHFCDSPWHGPLDRETPDPEAARRFLALFGLLDTIEPAALGSPTKGHMTVFTNLALLRASLESGSGSMQSPRCGLICEAAEGRVLGCEFHCGDQTLLQVARCGAEVFFPGQTGLLRVIGEGRCAVCFPAPVPEERKGFRALLYDLYGRPSKLEGGPWAGRRRFDLTPGCCVVITAGP